MNHPEELLREKAEQQLRQDPGLILRKDEVTIPVEIYDKNELGEAMQYRYTLLYIAIWNEESKSNHWSFVSSEWTGISPML